MKVLIIGSEMEYSLSLFYYRHLSKLTTVKHLPVQDEFREMLDGSLINKVLNRLSPELLLKKINREILEVVEEFKPDVVVIFKGLEVFPSTLRELSDRGVKLVNYNPDHPFMKNSIGSINSNIRNCVPLYDLHISYSQNICKEFETEHQLKAAWIPFGYELEQSLFEKICLDEEVERMCFLGNPDDKRTALIRAMAEVGYEIDVYGFYWDKYIKDLPQVNYYPAKYGEDFWHIIRQYRLQLNAFRDHNVGSHNMRTFDVPGAGGIILGESSQEQHQFFKQGEEAFFYDDLNQAKELGDYIMKLSTSEASKVRENARNRSEKDKYAYKHRAEEMYGELEKL